MTWSEVRSNFVEWYTTAAQTTEEWAKVGLGHYDRFGLNRQLDKRLAMLGAEFHGLLQEGVDPAAILERESIRQHRAAIEELEEAIRSKENEINDLRRRRPSSPEEEPPAE